MEDAKRASLNQRQGSAQSSKRASQLFTLQHIMGFVKDKRNLPV
jgi:hypothetical protein